jgi:hypothetical protein
MSVFTHGVNFQGKPHMIDRNQVFPVAIPMKMLRCQFSLARLSAMYLAWLPPESKVKIS